jgi:RHH-type proline utilization regulon transcriptional repressor/proline dehydrogenase/delta 1-pyrroline-5-carboxylate dehydrogenase
VFGPILHVVRFAGADLEKVVDLVNAKGYGLTMGVHSRIEETVERVRVRACAGNLYVNRNMIGATVGVQPFGGEGPLRHRPEGRRAALPLPLRHRTHGHGEYRRRRW